MENNENLSPAGSRRRLLMPLLIGGVIILLLVILFAALAHSRREKPSFIVPPVANDSDLMWSNVLAYDFYALKNDPALYEPLRVDLSKTALPEKTDAGITSFRDSLLNLCRECEGFYGQRADLNALRKERQAGILGSAAQGSGLTLASAVIRSAVTDHYAFSLGLGGLSILAHGANYLYNSQKAAEEYDQAVAQARGGLNDAIARTELALTNLRVKKTQWDTAQVFGEDAFRLYLQGLANLAANKPAQAIPLLLQTANYPGLVEAFFYLGNAYEQTGKAVDAAQAYQLLIDRAPKELMYLQPMLAEAHGRMARLAALQKKWGDARRHAQAAIALQQTNASYATLAAEIEFRQGNEKDAIEQFQRALQIEPDSAPANYGIAQALAASGRKDESLQYLRKAGLSGQVNLNAAAKAPEFAPLQTSPQFQSAVHLNFDAYVDWLPFHDTFVITNRNLFPVTNLRITVDRQNIDSSVEQTERVDRLDAGEAVRIGGLIAQGPKSRTVSFVCGITCDQGQWSALLQVNPPASKNTGASQPMQ